MLSGSLEFPTATLGETASISAPSVRFNRLSFQDSVISAYRRGLDTVRQKLSRKRGTVESLSGANSTNDSSLAPESNQGAVAGDTIYIPPQTNTEEAQVSVSGVGEMTEKTANYTVDSIAEVVPARSISTWPANCLEVSVLSDVEDACWVVEVCVPCSGVLSSSFSIAKLRERAIRQVTTEARAGP